MGVREDEEFIKVEVYMRHDLFAAFTDAAWDAGVSRPEMIRQLIAAHLDKDTDE